MGIREQAGGVDAVTEHLYDRFPDRPKVFDKKRVVFVDDKPIPQVELPKPEAVTERPASAPPPGRKGGRPISDKSLSQQKPWEAEGLSRAAWYKRLKKEKVDG